MFRAGKVHSAKKIQNLETIYRQREKLLESKEIMGKWQSKGHKQISDLSTKFLQGIDELLIAQKLTENIFKESATDVDSDLAIL